MFIRAGFIATSLILSLWVLEIAFRWFDVGDPPVFESDARYGYLMKPNQSISTRGYRFHINNAGFRGFDFVVPKPDGLSRVVFLGESVTYGGGVIRDEELFVSRIAASLSSSLHRPVEGINLSAPGWGIQNMRGFVEARGALDADVVVWVIDEADFRRPKTSVADHGFPTVKPRSRTLYLLSVGMQRVAYLFSSQRQTSIGRIECLHDNVRAFRKTLVGFRDRATRCLVVIVPSELPTEVYAHDLAVFRATADSLSIPFVDLAAVFALHRGEGLFTDGVHLTADGHKLVAEQLAPVMRDEFFTNRGRRGNSELVVVEPSLSGARE